MRDGERAASQYDAMSTVGGIRRVLAQRRSPRAHDKLQTRPAFLFFRLAKREAGQA